jgi:hypothetical protein
MRGTSRGGVVALAALAAVSASCGSDGSGTPATPACAGVEAVCGTVRGTTFRAIGGIAGALPTADCSLGRVGGTWLTFSAGLDLASPENLCVEVAGARYVGAILLAYDPPQPAAPVRPGSYPIAGGTDAGAHPYHFAVDAACRWLGPNVLATSGAITIESATAARVAGTVDLAFADGSRVAGRFDVPVPFSMDTCAWLTSGGAHPAACPSGVTCLPAAP